MSFFKKTLESFFSNFNWKSFRSFLIVGEIVFLLDYLLYQLVNILCNPFNSRLISYSISTWFAWYMNGRYSFPDAEGGFIKYFFGASVAGIQNVLISVYLIHLLGHSFILDLISIGFGCAYGLLFNFIFQSLVTFRKG